MHILRQRTHACIHADRRGERQMIPEGLWRCPSLWLGCCRWFPEWRRRWPERWQPRSGCLLHSGSLAAGGSYTGKNRTTNACKFTKQKNRLCNFCRQCALISHLSRITNSIYWMFWVSRPRVALTWLDYLGRSRLIWHSCSQGKSRLSYTFKKNQQHTNNISLSRKWFPLNISFNQFLLNSFCCIVNPTVYFIV